MLSVGDKAPQFTLNDAYGNKVTLSDLKGKKVVLYFYPKEPVRQEVLGHSANHLSD